MKKLHLIRHAKSSWSSGLRADIDRPLNQRGLRSCPIMAEQIVKAGCQFNSVFCSPAVRAQSTIEQIAQHLANRGADREIVWQADEALYTFEVQALLEWCRGLDDAIAQPVIVAHNPALTDLCNLLGDRPIENLPTCGYVQLAFNRSTWKELAADTAELTSFLTPKMFIKTP